jgi:hypothetical protein
LEHNEDTHGQRHRQDLKYKRSEKVARRAYQRSRDDRHDAYDPACVKRMSSKVFHSGDRIPDHTPILTPVGDIPERNPTVGTRD